MNGPPLMQRATGGFVLDRYPRQLVLVAVLVACAGLATALLLDSDAAGPALVDLVPGLVDGAAVAVAFRSLVLMMRAVSPARFVVARGAFLAPPAPVAGYYASSFVLLGGMAGAHEIGGWRARSAVGYQPDLLDRLNLGVSIVATLSMTAVAIFYAVPVLRGRPRLILSPAGLVQRGLLGTQVIGWDAVSPGRPVPIAGGGVTLTVVRPDLVTTRGRPTRSVPQILVSTFLTDVDTTFLADVIGDYTNHPEHRASIGTRSGYDQLLASLQAAHAAPTQPGPIA